ncbi:MAG: exodeoxyribonuclease VII small subunit [Candidatus Xenobia bacterium]
MVETPQSYDAARKELEGILNGLQEESVSIDRLSSNVQRAVELIKFCRGFLTRTEDEVKKALNDVAPPRTEEAPPRPATTNGLPDLPF